MNKIYLLLLIMCAPLGLYGMDQKPVPITSKRKPFKQNFPLSRSLLKQALVKSIETNWNRDYDTLIARYDTACMRYYHTFFQPDKRANDLYDQATIDIQNLTYALTVKNLIAAEKSVAAFSACFTSKMSGEASPLSSLETSDTESDLTDIEEYIAQFAESILPIIPDLEDTSALSDGES